MKVAQQSPYSNLPNCFSPPDPRTTPSSMKIAAPARESPASCAKKGQWLDTARSSLGDCCEVYVKRADESHYEKEEAMRGRRCANHLCVLQCVLSSGSRTATAAGSRQHVRLAVCLLFRITHGGSSRIKTAANKQR